MENKEDQILIANLNDKKDICISSNVMSHSSFLDAHQVSLADKEFMYDKHILYGGYEDAERRIMVFLPEYQDEIYEDDNPLALLRVETAKGSKELSHRDYLGSILSLGIDRSIIGDIIVKENGADIVVLSSMSDYLLQNYDKAGHVNLSCKLLSVKDLDIGSIKTEEKFETVASLRLDNLVCAAFNLSRTKAQDAIKQGLVFVNSREVLKSDFEVKEKDKLVLRGKGKAILEEVGRTTRKDRIAITIKKYI